jgi:hypothetical protein
MQTIFQLSKFVAIKIAVRCNLVNNARVGGTSLKANESDPSSRYCKFLVTAIQGLGRTTDIEVILFGENE